MELLVIGLVIFIANKSRIISVAITRECSRFVTRVH